MQMFVGAETTIIIFKKLARELKGANLSLIS